MPRLSPWLVRPSDFDLLRGQPGDLGPCGHARWSFPPPARGGWLCRWSGASPGRDPRRSDRTRWHHRHTRRTRARARAPKGRAARHSTRTPGRCSTQPSSWPVRSRRS